MKKLTKLTFIIFLITLTTLCYGQWSSSTYPKLTSGHATIERDNPYLTFNNTGDDDAGGIWYQNDGANTLFLFYNEGANRVDWQQGLTSYNGTGNPNQFTFDFDLPDVGPTTNGAFTIGHPDNIRMTFDVNEIQTVNTAGLSPLYINHSGGNVEVNGGNTDGDFIVGVENAFVVDNSEKWVSIGTSTPADNLHIKGTNKQVGAFTFNQADIRLEATHSKYIKFYEAATQKGFIGHDGTDMQVVNTETNGGVVIDGQDVELKTNGSTALAINNVGLVDLRKGSEALRLSGPNSYLSFYNGNAYNGYLWHSNTDMHLINIHPTGNLFFGTTDNINAAISPNGNFGIGTVTPDFKLEVIGNVNVTGELTAASDMRLKKNIAGLQNALETIGKLNPVSYDFRVDEFPAMDLVERRKMGLIAQEVEAVLPNLVSQAGTSNHINGEDMPMKSVNYMELVPMLIKGIQELDVALAKANQAIKINQESMVDLRDRLSQAESIINKMNK